jgi:ParB family chromosome partitioning protein
MTIETLPITKIEASKENPRKRFDETSIAGLAQSIRTDGLLQNLTVGKPSGKKKKYPLICGERRYRAIKLLIENGDLPKDFEVPVEVRADLTDEETLRIATIENVQRENLSPLEEAQALSSLVKA